MSNISQLMYVPILHTQTEAEDIFVSIRGAENQRPAHGTEGEQEKSVNEMWDGITMKINETNIPYPSIRIYQDSLPVCGMEAEIVKKLAAKGSRNHRVVLELMKKGAKLEGTEDLNLLIKEHDYLNELLGQASISIHHYRAALRKYKGKSMKLIKKRDVFIAERIKSTTRSGEVPLVFIGVRHQLEKLLKQEFIITYIIYRLPFKKIRDIYNV